MKKFVVPGSATTVNVTAKLVDEPQPNALRTSDSVGSVMPLDET